LLSTLDLPVVGYVSTNTALPSDLRFDEVNPIEYRTYNVRSLLAPAMPGTPPFLTPVADFGRFRVLDAPGRGYFDLVDVTAVAPITRQALYAVTARWLHSEWPAGQQPLWLDMKATAPAGLPRIPADGALPPPQPLSEAGKVLSEQQNGQVYSAQLEVARR